MTIMSDTLTVTRYSAQTRDSFGRVSALAAASTFTVRASVQRPDAKTLQKLMEGDRTEDAWHVDTVTQLNTADETSGTPADRIDIDGFNYEVFKVTKVRAVIPHYECLVLRLEEGLQP